MLRVHVYATALLRSVEHARDLALYNHPDRMPGRGGMTEPQWWVKRAREAHPDLDPYAAMVAVWEYEDRFVGVPQ